MFDRKASPSLRVAVGFTVPGKVEAWRSVSAVLLFEFGMCSGYPGASISRRKKVFIKIFVVM